ncbi:TolB family protein [Cecembia rubra]|uniref:WD40 repeat protein n=1 Tax=Cecembia rubra TaxID=1485585 RepID=A0A2P8E8F9_9BACT|nr:PD40 domain-containing protein [Cecembia rubra]PSL05744.1 WD40 repeat protein [Cecembia rubra]
MKQLKSILLLMILIGCDLKYHSAYFPEAPVNLDKVNSEWDDMNSDLSLTPHHAELTFSSNRSLQNHDFNLYNYFLYYLWDIQEGILSFSAEKSQSQDLDYLVSKAHSDLNEKVPYSFMDSNENKALLFSRDVDGIYAIHVVTEKPINSMKSRELTYFRILDDTSNEMYPCFYGKIFTKGSVYGDGIPEKILFSSDKDGRFDIYEMDIPAGMTPLEFLADAAPKEVRKLSINTSSNDHMPFVLGDKLVFASDRPGGLGGYDLYYAKKTAEGWSTPVNFGHPINSDFDEYRPIISPSERFQNNLMIFSSNRPGDKGGFDLYYVGVQK